MDRVIFFIDGFNVYHSLNEYTVIKRGSTEYKFYKYRKYLCLDLRAIGEKFTRKKDKLNGVYYFSAYATWKPYSMKRHIKFVDALKNNGVNVIMGKFKDKDIYCKSCGAIWKAKEEKQTDVNIAMYLFREALEDNYDTAIIVTNDTDLVSAIHMVKNTFPKKKIGVLFPIGRWASELNTACDFVRKIEEKHLRKCQLPDTVILSSGIALTRPRRWTNGHKTHLRPV